MNNHMYEGKRGSQNRKVGISELSPHQKKNFLFNLTFFSLVFFHISISVLNGLSKLMMNIMIKLLLLFLLKTKRLYSVILGEGRGTGDVGTTVQ